MRVSRRQEPDTRPSQPSPLCSSLFPGAGVGDEPMLPGPGAGLESSEPLARVPGPRYCCGAPLTLQISFRLLKDGSSFSAAGSSWACKAHGGVGGAFTGKGGALSSILGGEGSPPPLQGPRGVGVGGWVREGGPQSPSWRGARRTLEGRRRGGAHAGGKESRKGRREGHGPVPQGAGRLRFRPGGTGSPRHSWKAEPSSATSEASTRHLLSDKSPQGSSSLRAGGGGGGAA